MELLAGCYEAHPLGLAGWSCWRGATKACGCPTCPPEPRKAYAGSAGQEWASGCEYWRGTQNEVGCAKEFDGTLSVACSLNVANVREWQQWCTKGMCRRNVPFHLVRARLILRRVVEVGPLDGHRQHQGWPWVTK